MIQTMNTFLTLQKFKAKTVQMPKKKKRSFFFLGIHFHHFVLNKEEGISDLSTELITYIYIKHEEKLKQEENFDANNLYISSMSKKLVKSRTF